MDSIFKDNVPENAMPEDAACLWYVYILLCGDGTYYIGSTNNPARRLKAHRSGKGAKYTRGRGPLTMVFCEPCTSKSAALRKEYALKQLSHSEKDALIRSAGNPVVGIDAEGGSV